MRWDADRGRGLEGLPSSCHTMNFWQVELAGNGASKKVTEVVGEARTAGVQEKLNCHAP